jgi:branched-chain amino acid transport system ATP-binding protein
VKRAHPILECNGVVVYYGKFCILSEVSLSVNEGEVVSVLGPNGAGKTTLVRTIVGLEKCVKGSIKFKDLDLTKLPPHKITEAGITLIPERRRVFPDMTVMENLEMGAFLLKDKEEFKKRLDFVFEIFPKLKDRQSQLAFTLSGGEQQMLAIGRGLMSNPKLLILDEPSLGLAPIIVEGLFSIIKELRKEMTILLVEQNVRAALDVSDRAYILSNGKIIQGDTVENLVKKADVVKLYLGL